MASTSDSSTYSPPPGWGLIKPRGQSHRGPSKRVTVRFTSFGRGCLTKAAFDLLGRPAAMRFYANGETGSVGIEPLNETVQHGIKVRQNHSGGATFTAASVVDALNAERTTLTFNREESGLFIFGSEAI